MINYLFANNDSFAESTGFTEFSLEEELTEIQNNTFILSKDKHIPINEFWVHVEKKHFNDKKKSSTISIAFLFYIFNVIFMWTMIFHTSKYKSK